MYSHCMFMSHYLDWGFSMLFSQLQGKCQGKTCKDGARPALFLIFLLFYVFFVLFYYLYAVLCIVCFVSFSVMFVGNCVLNYCHRVATQLQLNLSYHISKSKSYPTTTDVKSWFATKLSYENLDYEILVWWKYGWWNYKFLFKHNLNLLTTSHVTIKAASYLLDLCLSNGPLRSLFITGRRILVLRSSLILISHFTLPAFPEIISNPHVPEVASSLVLSLFSLYWCFIPFFAHFIGDSVDWSQESQLY
jgi:hypothetical protein